GPQEEEKGQPCPDGGPGEGGLEIHRRQIGHLSGQNGGYAAQRQDPAQSGGEEGGEQSVEQFSCQISFGRKTAAAQEGQDLTMDRKPGPSQQKGGQCQPSGQ